ncbi:MAG: inverse autotransporter beta domain-containing protein [Ignavibacteria bacterium]
MTRRLQPVLTALCRLAPVIPLLAGTPAHAEADSPKWGPHIDFEAKPGSKRTLGEADLFLPVVQNADTLVFANLRARVDNESSREGNLGAGVRRMLESGWNLGAYGYLDRRRSPDTGYHYGQTTLGAEALGRDWDFRANAYQPSGTRVRDLGTTPGVSSAAVSGASVLITTTAAISREERALKGVDGEVGWRAPIFDTEAGRQLRLYAGAYRFSDDVVTVKGPRLRAELTLDDLDWFGKGTRLFLGLEAQHDNARGQQNFLSVRLRIPLGKETGRAGTLNWQERRMTAPVMRDVDIVTQGRSFVTTPASVETATAGGNSIAVVNSTTTDGAAAVQAALDAAGANSTVILSGTFNLAGTVTLNAGQTLMGSGSVAVNTASGRVATLTVSQGASISSLIGLASTPTISMANNSALKGVTIVRSADAWGGGRSVDVIGVSGVTLANNTLSTTMTNANAFGVFVDASSNITITGNTISASRPGATGIGLYLRDSSVLVANNTLSGSGTTPYAAFLAYTGGHTLTLQPGSSGNVIAAGTCQNAGGGGTLSGSMGYTASGIPGTCP